MRSQNSQPSAGCMMLLIFVGIVLGAWGMFVVMEDAKKREAGKVLEAPPSIYR